MNEKQRKLLRKYAIKKNIEDIPNNLFDNVNIIIPPVFSYFNNTHETFIFFNKLINTILSMKKDDFICFNLFFSKTEVMTIDSLMYLIAITYNTHCKGKVKYHLKSVPGRKVNDIIYQSGIENYYQIGEGIDIVDNDNCIKIVNGNKTNPEIAKEICDFVIEKFHIEKVQIRFLYDMLIELMTNAGQHAYEISDMISSQWFIFVEYKDEKTVQFTFIDTGNGIPNTMSNKLMYIDDIELSQKLFPIIQSFNENDKFNHINLIISGLKEGSLRTKTNKEYRGKGLPEIYSYFKDRNLTYNLKILSGKCLIEFNNLYRDKYDFKTFDVDFIGTLFYWEIRLEDVNKGVIL